MASETTTKRSKMAAEGCGAPSMSSRRLALFVNSNSLETDFINSKLLPAEARPPLRRYFIPEWRLPKFEADYFFDSTIFSVMQMPEEFSLNEFPDELLVEVFRRVHQTDRIHSVSLVCRRWNRLLYTPGLWTSVRMDIRTEEQSTAAKAFLKREDISDSLVKLDLRYSNKDLGSCLRSSARVLPEKLPKLLHYQSVGEVTHRETFFEFLDKAMPVLETLILNDETIVFSSKIPDTSKCLFKKLRNCSTDFFLFPFFPRLENLKELDVCCNRPLEIRKYPELQKLRLRGDASQPSVLQNLRSLSRLVTLDISLHYYDPDSMFIPQFIAAVRNLHFLEHLHWFSLRMSFPVAGLFAPPERESDFPSRLKYLSLVYSEPIVVEEVTLSCPELRSLYLNTFNRDCVISESVFVKIADRLRKLVYLRMNSVSSSVASMLNAQGEDALPHLRYLHSGAIEEGFPFESGSRSLTLSEIAEVESLLSKRKNLTVLCGKLSYPTWFINGKAHESVDSSSLLLRRLLGSEEGGCCVFLYNSQVSEIRRY